MGRNYVKRGKKESGGGETVVLVFFFFWFCCWVLQFLVNHCRGHWVVGGCGHGGQDSFQFPGARELDRLLLAGQEVSCFGQSWSVHQARQGSRERTTISAGISIRSRYFIMNC